VKKLNSFIILLGLSMALNAQVFQDQCNPDTFDIDTNGFAINWQQFPDFDLPFTVVYHGFAPSDSMAWPLRKGFSHISGRGTEYIDTIWPHQRSYTWTGIANADNWAATTNQPWRMIKSPWGNDIEGYRIKWNHRLQNSVLTNYYKYHPPEGEARADIIVADLEWAYHSDAGILSIKYDTLVPDYYQNLSDEDFIFEYKRDMALLYAEPLKLAVDSLHLDIILSSYAEIPIRRTWYGIDDTSWFGWRTDSSRLDFLMEDTTGMMNSTFYNLHDYICPSIYNFYNIDTTPIGKKYLAYNLFQIEVNKEWSDKEQLVYCWLNYHSGSSYTEAIQPWMAEATAIFPFMSGIKGLYPWKPALPYGYDSYEYFIKGLYRLSQFDHFFDGEEEYVSPWSAHTSFIYESPIWRGVANGNNILIAAQNPYANMGDTTYIKVSYEDWSDTIGLVGTEVFLCDFLLSTVSIEEPEPGIEIKVFPNPSTGIVNISSDNEIQAISLIEIKGKALHFPVHPAKAQQIDISALPTGIYFMQIRSNDQHYYKKIIKK